MRTNATGLLRKAALPILLVLAVLAWLNAGKRQREQAERTQVREPVAFQFQCAGCGHAWETDAATGSSYYASGMPTELQPIRCVSCGEGKAFLKTRCPWCRGHFLPADPWFKKDSKPSRMLCPLCGKDILTWRRTG
jgi:hypothetical protein